MRFKYSNILTTCALAASVLIGGSLINSCGHHHDEHDEHEHDEHHEEGEHHHEAGEIVVSPEKAKAAGVTVETIAAGTFNEVIATSGRILPAASGVSTVSATIPGIVTLTRPWTAGMPVSAGSALFHISQSKLPEGDMKAAAGVELRRSKAEYDRISKLYNEHLAEASEYESAKAAYELASQNFNALSAGGSGSITASKGGYVLNCLVKDGDYVETGAPLMTITSTMRLQLTADLPIRYASRISEFSSANFELPANETVYSLSALNGRLVSHSAIAESGSPYVTLTFDFDNAPGVVAGSFAEVFLLGSPRQGVISVPVSALTEEQGLHYVYIREDEDCYRKQRVETGASDGKRIEITSGLKAGETVVVTGATAIRLASMSTAIPGHTHNH